MASFYEELQKLDNISDENENAHSRANVDKWIFRLFLLLIGVMPLIVLANVEEVISPLLSNHETLTSGTKGELFTHFKSLFLIVVTLIAGLLLLVKVFFMEGTIHKTYLNYGLAIFLIMIVVSTVASPSITIALNGLYNRSDGAISWLCYISLMFIAMNIEYPKNVVKYILFSFVPFIVFNLYIITMNFYGKDLLQYELLQKVVAILLPEGANIGEGSQLLGTLNQWNYMSGMFAVMTIMYLTWAIKEKYWGLWALAIAVSVISLTVMLMSLSTGGFVTFVAIMLVVLLLAFRSKNKFKSLGSIILVLLIISPIFHVLAKENPRIWSESVGFFINDNPYVTQSNTTSSLNADFNINWNKKAYAAENNFELPVLPESKMSAGTGRTYIWEKTLGLVSERPLLGYGMDTLMYQFPHYNLDARGGLRTEHTIVDKPHNMYIGVLYGVGIIGFIALLVIIFVTVFNMMKEIFINPSSNVNILIVAWFAFAIQFMFNDSLPGITPIMWLFAGITFAILKSEKLKVS